MGGYVSLSVFLQRRDVDAVCVWATPFDLGRLIEMRNHPDLAGLKPEFFEDALDQDLSRQAGDLHHVLVIHGGEDEVVPADHAEPLFRAASEPKTLLVIPEADHRFTDPDHRFRAAEHSIQWFEKYLRHG